MEPIQASLRKWMQENSNFKENFERMQQQVRQDPEVKAVLEANPQLTEQDIQRNLMRLYEYTTQSKQCQDCPSLGECRNILNGYTPSLEVDGNVIRLAYDKCHTRLQQEEREKQQSRINSLYMPKDILEASTEMLDHGDAERQQAILKTLQFLQQTGDTIPEKGLYFYGPFGVGKTYFLGAIANYLAERNISSMLIYMPEFVREMKASLKDDSVNEKVELFKKTPVLMLDDIGAESQSAWFRDEILGSILHYRMMERLPVFFTSNYSIAQLEQQIATTNRGDVERVKAGRIMERIKRVATEVPLFGKNRRND
ncbi:primosomal protein DnaI [Virgibacillus sp. 7505]|jgi:primosomal protein DnaI|uniref:primosomal protein DnaI n=1 Tax=Bacillaceae TaxID=186817 RepID=UPI000BA50040|nr:primosomal protein DnaI [Virgibacillus sp. 7505]PAE17386.1 primosomal protein DnaI [Virgibacillus sp. 7505]